MKKILKLSGLMMVISLYLAFTLKAQSITIDGDFSDWNSIPYAHQNAEGAGTLMATKTFATTDDVFFYLEATEVFTLERFDIYFDTDNNPNTGFISNGFPAGSGADILCQGNLFGGTIYNGGVGYNWNPTGFTFANAMSFSPVVTLTGKKAIEFSIKKTAIGVTTGFMNFAFVDSNDSYAELGTMPQINLSTSKFIQVPLDGTLPVTLISFEARSYADGIKLSWNTASEKNNSHFNINRSADGINFEKIGRVNGNNNSSSSIAYTFTDQYPPSDQLYYRLEQVDLNGEVTVFDHIIDVKIVKTTRFNISKLSGQDVIQVGVYSESKTESEFQLTDINGRKLIRKSISLLPGYQTFTFPLIVNTGINVATLSTPLETLRQKVFIH